MFTKQWCYIRNDIYFYAYQLSWLYALLLFIQTINFVYMYKDNCFEMAYFAMKTICKGIIELSIRYFKMNNVLNRQNV